MKYRNGKEFLPTELLKELQRYVQGELVYIPKRENKRAGWGENNGARMRMQKRNREIYQWCIDRGIIADLPFVGRQHSQDCFENPQA